MVETIDDGFRDDAMAGGNAVSFASPGRERQGWVAIWDTRPKRRMWTSAIVMVDPLVQHAPEMIFAEGNDEVETLRRMVPMRRSQKALDCRLRTGVFKTRRLKPLRCLSSASEKMPSRSRTR